MCLKLLEYYLEGDDCIIFEGNVHEYIIFVNFCFDQLYRSQLLVYALFFFVYFIMYKIYYIWQLLYLQYNTLLVVKLFPTNGSSLVFTHTGK